MLQQLGKFQIRRVLGQGGQSTVFLAQDPQLQRLVAIKLLRLARGSARSALLDEARTSSRLRHPNIAAVHEAGEDGDSSYVVFEYVEGRPLDRVVREDGAMDAPRAVGVMLGVLDALIHAHAAGIVHRDLKPANIMIDRDHRPRVLDFGIARRAGGHQGTQTGALMGTPMYMAPEYIAKEQVAPSNDVFAAGLILYELLFGTRAIDASTDFEALHRIVNEPLVFPKDAFELADERLIDVIAKATARDPALRYGSAAQMRDALKAWLQPVTTTAPASGGTLEFLLRRLQHGSDFPSMSAAMTAVKRLAQSEQGDAVKLSSLILKDFALTNKLLRVANSAHYNCGRAGTVSTVSRAIVVLGFDAVRGLAMSLLLFERLQDKQHAEALKEQFLRATLGGALARELGAQVGGSGTEEYFVCATFHNLGRLLAHYYLRDEALAVDKLASHEGIAEDLAARRVLGIGYRDLGIGVARHWGFPDTLLRSMEAAPPPRLPPAATADRLQMVSAAADTVCGAIERSAPEQRAAAITQAIKPYAAAMPVDERTLRTMVDRALDATSELARALNLDLRRSALGQKLAGTPSRVESASVGVIAGGAVGVDTADAGDGTAPGGDARAILAAGIQDITQGLLEDLGRADLLRIVVETAYRALGFRRVLLCLRDERERTLVGRHACGEEGTRPWDVFRVPVGGSDLFSLTVARNADLLIHDASAPKVRERLPGWYVDAYLARSFLLMPMRRGDAAVGLLYADSQAPGGIRIGEAELALLKTLRNQAVLVIKSAA